MILNRVNTVYDQKLKPFLFVFFVYLSRLNLFNMKTFKFILIFSLCILSFSSCKKDNDLGGGEYVPEGKFLSKYGMKAYFPENGWGNQLYDKFNSAGFEMECIFAYLKENEEVRIFFMRFVSPFEDENAANEMVEFIKYIYAGEPDYILVSADAPVQISSYNNASKTIYKTTTSGLREETYYIYQKNRLYRIVIIMPENKVDDYHAECLKIVNTLEITDN